MKIKTILSAVGVTAALFGLTMCHENLSDGGTYKPPKEEIKEPESGLWASFESKYNRYSEGRKHPGQANAARIRTKWVDTMWLNDRAHTQIMVWSNDESYDNLEYVVSDLTNGTNTIPASSVSLKFGKYVKGHVYLWGCREEPQIPTDEVMIADALMKTPVTSISPAEDPIKIWLTVDTPKSAAPGKYTGSLTVKSGEASRKLDIELLVTGHTLPDVKDWDFHLDMWQFPYQLMAYCTPRVTFASTEYFNLMEPLYRMAADAGQKCISTYIRDGAFDRGETMVKWIKKANGTWEFDYTDFDKFVAKMMEWGITKQIDCFSLAGWHARYLYYDEALGRDNTMEFLSSLYASEMQPGQGVIGDAKYREVWTAFLDSFEPHVKAKGWFDKIVFYMDETSHDDMNHIVDLIKGHNPDWKIGLAGNGLSLEMEQKMYDYCVLLGRVGHKVTPVKTFYTCCTNLYPNNYVSTSTDPAELVWMGWHASGNNMNGYLRWAYDYWGTSDPTDATHGERWPFSAGDGHMVYYLNNSSAGNDAVASIRIQMMREGIQDYEKIRILNNSQLKAYAEDKFKVGTDIYNEVNATGKKARGPVVGGQALLKRVSAGN